MKIISFLFRHIKIYPTSKNLKYSFGIGFVLSVTILLQIITGLFLSSFYVPHASIAEASVGYIVNEISNGFLVQRFHVIFASIVFILLYLHLARAVFYKMYRWENRITWWSGLGLLYLCIAEAFTGYILPWGQMSFWGATVITNLVSIIPFVGEPLIKFIWGGSIVGTLTLERFFMVHYLLPSIILGLVILHLTSLHKLGSSSVYKSSQILDLNFMTLYPYFIIKDLFIFLGVLGVGFYLVCFYPDYFDNLVNNVSANSKITPKHIVPEWYFLSFYIILKLITIKWVGILIMFGFMLFPVVLPFLNKR